MAFAGTRIDRCSDTGLPISSARAQNRSSSGEGSDKEPLG
jgi:hypothetical protein